MKKLFIILGILCIATRLYAAPTKSTDTVDEWAEVGQNAVREGATKDVSGAYDVILHISVALSDTTAHTGSKIDVQLSSNTTGDEDWTTLTTFIGPTGTGNTEALGGNEAAGQTVLEVADEVGYVADETRWIFLEDNTVADSEMLLLVSAIVNTSVTVQDGTANAHTSADILNNIAETYVIQLPMSANRVRVIYDNTYDSNGATIHTYCRLSKTTGI